MQNKKKIFFFSLFLPFIFINTVFLISPLKVQKNVASKKEFSVKNAASSGTFEWEWMSGNNTINNIGVYFTKGEPNVAFYPGSREGSASWTDVDGNLWLLGGYGNSLYEGIGYLNDLWRYNISSGMWTWMSGNASIDDNGVYGTKGVPSASNYPGSKYLSASWIDLDGNLWLFGGRGNDESGSFGRLNELWRYNISSRMWTWISGNKTINENGVYGMKGVSEAANYPGSRFETVSWFDLDGNLWLFGGRGHDESGSYGRLNDLWRYNISSGMWTWVSGNKTIDENGVYGTKGLPDAANYPGGREVTGSYTSVDGILWLFGGNGYPESGGIGYLNDLWRYNISSGMWTWISGNETSGIIYGKYGTKGVPDAANYPGSRWISSRWTELDGDLWLFGGYGYAESGGIDYLNDLWRYEISSGMWTWISGNKTTNEYGVYGTKGVPDAVNYPGSRWDSVLWTDMDGNLWVFGGWGYAKSGSEGTLNDLWRFDFEFDSVPVKLPVLVGDDDDDDEEADMLVMIVVIIVVISAIGGVALVVVLIKKGIIGTSKLKRNLKNN